LAVGNTTLDLNTNGEIGLEVVANALGGNSLAVVGRNTGLYPEITPTRGKDLGETDGDTLDKVFVGSLASLESVKAILGGLLVDRSVGPDVTEDLFEISGILLCGCDLDIDLGSIEDLKSGGLEDGLRDETLVFACTHCCCDFELL
jgi:hypothetical protein